MSLKGEEALLNLGRMERVKGLNFHATEVPEVAYLTVLSPIKPVGHWWTTDTVALQSPLYTFYTFFT